MKTVYLFDDITGEYLNEYIAHESPLEHGIYITPICSTHKKPLPNKDNNAVCFNGEDWEYRPDYRGTVWYVPDGSRVMIDALGVAPPDGALSAPPVDQAATVRVRRNLLLDAADIAINIAEDNGQPSAELRQYRQALRDVPQQAGFPDSVVWPEAPL